MITETTCLCNVIVTFARFICISFKMCFFFISIFLHLQLNKNRENEQMNEALTTHISFHFILLDDIAMEIRKIKAQQQFSPHFLFFSILAMSICLIYFCRYVKMVANLLCVFFFFFFVKHDMRRRRKKMDHKKISNSN